MLFKKMGGFKGFMDKGTTAIKTFMDKGRQGIKTGINLADKVGAVADKVAQGATRYSGALDGVVGTIAPELLPAVMIGQKALGQIHKGATGVSDLSNRAGNALQTAQQVDKKFGNALEKTAKIQQNMDELPRFVA